MDAEDIPDLEEVVMVDMALPRPVDVADMVALAVEATVRPSTEEGMGPRPAVATGPVETAERRHRTKAI